MRSGMAVAAGALCASLAAAQPQTPQTREDATGRSGPSEPGSAEGREQRRGESREVSQENIAEVQAALEKALPRERLQRLRVYNREGRAYVGGTVRSEAEKDALRRTLFQLVSPEQVVLDVEVRPEGGP